MVYKIIDYIARILSYIINIYVIKSYSYLKNKTIWYAYKRKFARAGEDVRINVPFQIKSPERISIGSNVYIGRGAILEVWGDNKDAFINIGNDVCIAVDCHIGAINGVTIDNGVLIAGKVLIEDHLHGNTTRDDLLIKPVARELVSKGKIHICENVWIGENVVVMPGVTIGKGAIIGANSTVTKSIPEYSVAVGSPAKVIKTFNRMENRSETEIYKN